MWPGCKGKQKGVSAFVQCKESPLCVDGTYRPFALVLSEAVGILPEKLFPAKLYAHVLPDGIPVRTFQRLTKRMERELDQFIGGADKALSEANLGLLRVRIEKLLKTMSYREREIIKLRYGLGDGYSFTPEEVAHIFKVTRNRIGQIEAKAVRKLQRHDRSQGLVGFLD
jgi:hypothetical protein